MCRPTDWPPLGRATDPAPGDPVVVRDRGQYYQQVAQALVGAAATLRTLNGGVSSNVTRVGLLLLAVLLSCSGCFPVGSPPPPGGWGPPLPVVIGARIDGGDLIVSTGRNCPEGTYINLRSVGGSEGFEATTLTSLNRINITHPGDDLSVQNEAINPIDWPGGMGLLRGWAVMGDGSSSWGVELQLPADLVYTSSSRPADQYYWGASFGWLTPAQVKARDGVDLLTICTPV